MDFNHFNSPTKFGKKNEKIPYKDKNAFLMEQKNYVQKKNSSHSMVTRIDR